MSGALPAAVVLVGASGFLGRHFVDALRGKVETLVGVTSQTVEVPGCTEVVTLGRLGELGPLPAETAVIHVGAYRYDPERFALAQSDILLNNAELNARVYHFCAERGIAEVRLASSVAVYPGDLPEMDDRLPLDLNGAPHAGEAFYAWSKRWAEVLAGLYAQRFGVNTVAFRLSNPYGAYDSTNPNKAHVAPAFVMKALDANPVFPIRGNPLVERDFVYAGDVVEIVLRSLNWRGRNDAFNLCTGRATTLQELAETAMRVAGVVKPIEAGAPGAFGPNARRASAEKIKAAFGYEFADLETGLGPTVEWYRHAFKP